MKTCYIQEDLEIFSYSESALDHRYEKVEFEAFNFSGGEVHIKITRIPSSLHAVRINCRIKKSDDLMRLILVVDALRAMGFKHIEAFIPYIPYARQDRRMIIGEPLSIKVFAKLINDMNLDEVICYDVHSDITTVLINNLTVINNFGHAGRFISQGDLLNNGGSWGSLAVVSPDAGAYKKVLNMCQHICYNNDIIIASKNRDVTNGKIISTTISGDVKGRDCLIVDDICDGGATFIELAKTLKEKGAERLFLFVSHGIFSKGYEVLSEWFDVIGTTNSFKKSTEYPLSIKVINLEY